MIQLTYSNRTEGLLEALAADLAEARAEPGASLLAPACEAEASLERRFGLYFRLVAQAKGGGAA